MSADAWAAFQQRFKETKLYMEYTVGNPQSYSVKKDWRFTA